MGTGGENKNYIMYIVLKVGSSSFKSGFSRGSCSPVMLLSMEQKGMLKDPTTKVKFEQENPKNPGSMDAAVA